ncbi:MAG: hypothetical protein ABJQ85_06350 [Rhizobiaceae bacterium]
MQYAIAVIEVVHDVTELENQGSGEANGASNGENRGKGGYSSKPSRINRFSSFLLFGTGFSGSGCLASLARSMAACEGLIGGPARPQADNTAAIATSMAARVTIFLVNSVAISPYRPACSNQWCFISRFLVDTTR